MRVLYEARGGLFGTSESLVRVRGSKPSIVSLPSFVEHFIPPVTKDDEENRICWTWFTLILFNSRYKAPWLNFTPHLACYRHYQLLDLGVLLKLDLNRHDDCEELVLYCVLSLTPWIFSPVTPSLKLSWKWFLSWLIICWMCGDKGHGRFLSLTLT